MYVNIQLNLILQIPANVSLLQSSSVQRRPYWIIFLHCFQLHHIISSCLYRYHHDSYLTTSCH